MIDYFALALTHALVLLALIRLVGRAELDEDPAMPHGKKRKPGATAVSEKSDGDA